MKYIYLCYNNNKKKKADLLDYVHLSSCLVSISWFFFSEKILERISRKNASKIIYAHVSLKNAPRVRSLCRALISSSARGVRVALINVCGGARPVFGKNANI